MDFSFAGDKFHETLIFKMRLLFKRTILKKCENPSKLPTVKFKIFENYHLYRNMCSILDCTIIHLLTVKLFSHVFLLPYTLGVRDCVDM